MERRNQAKKTPREGKQKNIAVVDRTVPFASPFLVAFLYFS